MPPSFHAPHLTARAHLDLRENAAAVELVDVDAGAWGAAAVATWHGRMVNEHGSAKVFEGLAEQLASAGFPAHVVAQCEAFAHQERRHGVLCGAVVEALGGSATAEVSEATSFVEHEPSSGELEAALCNLLSVCCLSETVAVALISAERMRMPDGPLRKLLTEIYRDEIGHSRFGWRLVAKTLSSLEPSRREVLQSRLGRYLELAFAHLEEHELEHIPVPSTSSTRGAAALAPEAAALGLCNGDEARALFYDTVRQVIVPNLEALGIRASESWRQRGVHA